MNLVFLSPHFPRNYVNFCTRLREQGGNILGIADTPYQDLSHPLRQALSEYYQTDMGHYDNLVRACGWFTHKYGKLDRVESHNEFWLETEARLRQDFNMFGPLPHEVAEFTLKSRMKEKFREAGVEVAPGRIVNTIAEARALISEIGYPVVAKPDRGVGASSTFKIRNEAELQLFFSAKPDADYIMEGFVRGVIHSFDGLTDRDGKVVFCTSHVFSQGIMETVNEDQDLFYYSQRTIPADLEEAGMNTIRAFGIKEKFFHLEYFRTIPDNRIVGIEVNMRPPGGLSMDMFNFANDIDLYKEWASVVMHNRFAAKYSRPYHCAYVSQKSRKRYAHSHDDIQQAQGHLIVHQEPISSVFSAAIGDYGYLIRSPELDELFAAARYIQQLA